MRIIHRTSSGQLGFVVVCAIVLSLRGPAWSKQERGTTNGELGIPNAARSDSDFEIKIDPGKEFLVRRKGTQEWLPSSKLSDPLEVGSLDGGDKIYLPAKVIKPPKARHMQDPHYPEGERKSGQAGRVWLHVVVDGHGVAHFPTVDASPGPEFSKSAVEAVKTWTFEPAKLNGQPVAVLINISMDFRLY
jgi:TonB family protein